MHLSACQLPSVCHRQQTPQIGSEISPAELKEVHVCICVSAKTSIIFRNCQRILFQLYLLCQLDVGVRFSVVWFPDPPTEFQKVFRVQTKLVCCSLDRLWSAKSVCATTTMIHTVSQWHIDFLHLHSTANVGVNLLPRSLRHLPHCTFIKISTHILLPASIRSRNMHDFKDVYSQ